MPDGEVGLRDKQYQYFGSNRIFYSGITLGSTTAYSFIAFSGTNTKFGAAGNELSNRLSLAASGTSFFQWAYVSGTAPPVTGELWGGNTITQDGIHLSGLWMRSKSASQVLQIWAW